MPYALCGEILEFFKWTKSISNLMIDMLQGNTPCPGVALMHLGSQSAWERRPAHTVKHDSPSFDDLLQMKCSGYVYVGSSAAIRVAIGSSERAKSRVQIKRQSHPEYDGRRYRHVKLEDALLI